MIAAFRIARKPCEMSQRSTAVKAPVGKAAHAWEMHELAVPTSNNRQAPAIELDRCRKQGRAPANVRWHRNPVAASERNAVREKASVKGIAIPNGKKGNVAGVGLAGRQLLIPWRQFEVVDCVRLGADVDLVGSQTCTQQI